MSSVRQNVSSLLLSEIARRILGFFAVAYLARTLGVEGFGMVMIGLTALSYVSLTGSAGLHVLGTRSVARGTGEVDPGTLIGARLLTTGGAIVVVAVVSVLWIEPPELAAVVLVTSLSGVLHALFLEWYFQGRERLTEVAVARTLGAAFYLSFLVVAVHDTGDLTKAALAAVIGDLGSTGYLLLRYRRSVGILRIRFGEWRSLLAAAWPFGAGSVLGHLTANFPLLAVGAILGSGAAGVFAGGNKLVFFVLMADRILGTLLLPASTRLRQLDAAQLSSVLSRSMRWILLLGLPMGVGGAMVATPLVVLVYGEAFSASGPVFGILIWYAMLTMLHTVYTSALLASDGERRYRNVMAVSALANVAAVTGGILIGDVLGAAVGLLLAEGLSLVLMQRAVRVAMVIPAPVGFGRGVMASIALAVILMLLPDMHVLLTVLWGALAYVGAAMVTRALTTADLRELTQRTR
ncbi:MAG: flippase [Bacteroidetes bacterium]|nr:flippase [Bacteroidota bacterium]